MLELFKKQLIEEWKQYGESEYRYKSNSILLRILPETCSYYDGYYRFVCWVNDKGDTYTTTFKKLFWNVGEQILPEKYKEIK